MTWQLTDRVPKTSEEHIPLARCSSVVSLSLSGYCIKKLRNTQRRAKTQEGSIYDPWAPVWLSLVQLLLYMQSLIICNSGTYSTFNATLITNIAWIATTRQSIM